MRNYTRYIPNGITMFRLLGAGCLACTVPFSPDFYGVYTFCGITDVLDGLTARALHAESELGSKLDSIGDLLFYSVAGILLLPYLTAHLPALIWCCVGIILMIRLASYGLAAFRYHRFASLHTWGNKLTGAALFSFPYLVQWVSVKTAGGLVAVIALASSAEELLIHMTSKNYDPGRKSLFGKRAEIGKKIDVK